MISKGFILLLTGIVLTAAMIVLVIGHYNTLKPADERFAVTFGIPDLKYGKCVCSDGVDCVQTVVKSVPYKKIYMDGRVEDGNLELDTYTQSCEQKEFTKEKSVFRSDDGLYGINVTVI
jgi:hypothetical protein